MSAEKVRLETYVNISDLVYDETTGGSGGRTCGGMTRRILGGNDVGVGAGTPDSEVVVDGEEPFPVIERTFGATLTSVFVVKRSASPLDCGFRETVTE